MASKMEDEESEQIELSGADSMSEGTTSNFSSPTTRASRIIDEKRSRINWGQCEPSDTVQRAYASTEAKSRVRKIGLIGVSCRAGLSAIKLIRTGTTLDLSQKAKRSWGKKKKKKRSPGGGASFYTPKAVAPRGQYNQGWKAVGPTIVRPGPARP
ncbi:hypothetical protein N7455_012505, partial [Penicillium solitum]|uniref:uncharacterized protein n=1 Tax=Penicillium solitum TaxID=60172 RepID=UPI0032C41178